MTSQEYTQWLKGFLDAVDGYNITKRQFDSIREKLKEVEDTPIGFPIGNGGFGTPAIVPQLGGGWINANTQNIMPLSGTGTITSGNTITTTQLPSGATLTYTDSNGNGSTYTIPNTTNNIFTNQSSKDDEKLLMD
jgi:hypothetical protein